MRPTQRRSSCPTQKRPSLVPRRVRFSSGRYPKSRLVLARLARRNSRRSSSSTSTTARSTSCLRSTTTLFAVTPTVPSVSTTSSSRPRPGSKISSFPLSRVSPSLGSAQPLQLATVTLRMPRPMQAGSLAVTSSSPTHEVPWLSSRLPCTRPSTPRARRVPPS